MSKGLVDTNKAADRIETRSEKIFCLCIK